MTEIIWEDPPEVVRGGKVRRSRWDERLNPLREHPGKWANFGEWGSSTSSDVKLARIGHHQPGEFEAVMRNVDKATARGILYVRFVGADPVDGP